MLKNSDICDKTVSEYKDIILNQTIRRLSKAECIQLDNAIEASSNVLSSEFDALIILLDKTHRPFICNQA